MEIEKGLSMVKEGADLPRVQVIICAQGPAADLGLPLL
jgi:superfamily II DNA or RNA helicase